LATDAEIARAEILRHGRGDCEESCRRDQNGSDVRFREPMAAGDARFYYHGLDASTCRIVARFPRAASVGWRFDPAGALVVASYVSSGAPRIRVTATTSRGRHRERAEASGRTSAGSMCVLDGDSEPVHERGVASETARTAAAEL